MLRKSENITKNKFARRNSLKRFMETSSLNSLKYVRKEGLLMKVVWICINFFLVSLTAYIIGTLWVDFTENPTVTSLEQTNYPVTDVPFPAVAVCNVNKISRRKAEELAIIISKSSGVQIGEIKDYIKTLGAFYNFDGTYVQKQMRLQTILEKLPNASEFQLANLMRKLAPSCEDFLDDCLWARQKINCSKIFQTRLTFEGYCCIFNYVKMSNEKIDDSFRKAEILHGSRGLSAGLTVGLKHDIEDYFFTKVDTLGANVHIFNPEDYPDKNSGSLIELLVGFSKEFFVQLKPFGLHTVKEALQYAPEKRQCFFPFERKSYMGFYSESNCLIDCRLQSMVALCGCIPFMFPQNYSLICGLSDIQCLAKYKAKWERLRPSNFSFVGILQREAHSALDCTERCFPVCDSFLYKINTNSAPIRYFTSTNNSLVHVYYSRAYAKMYQQDLRYYWFEIISNFGGICSLTLGVSLITIVEIVSFCMYKLYNYIYYNVVYEDDFVKFVYQGFK